MRGSAVLLALASCAPAPAPVAVLPPPPLVGTILHVAAVYRGLCPEDCGAVDSVASPFEDLASIVVSERSLLTYNPTAVEESGCAWGIFAHEFGHHLDGRLRRNRRDRRVAELVADRWAGCAMATAGISSEPYRFFLETSAAYGGETHPPGWIRVGWVSAGEYACRN